MRKLTALVMVFTIITSLGVFASSASETELTAPGTFVDFGTQAGFEKFKVDSEARDTVVLETEQSLKLEEEKAGDYSVHGMDGKVNYTFNPEGYTTFVPKEPLDSKLKNKEGERVNPDWRMTCEFEFDSKEYNYIAVYYRISDGAYLAQNNFYIRDDQHAGQFCGVIGTWYPSVSLKKDGQWHKLILDLKTQFPGVSGTVKGLRLPIVSREGETFDVMYAAAFKTKDAAEGFDYNAYLAEITPTAEPTSAPDVEKDTDSVTDDEKEKGCGSIISGSFSLMIALVAAVVVFKKRN